METHQKLQTLTSITTATDKITIPIAIIEGKSVGAAAHRARLWPTIQAFGWNAKRSKDFPPSSLGRFNRIGHCSCPMFPV